MTHMYYQNPSDFGKRASRRPTRDHTVAQAVSQQSLKVLFSDRWPDSIVAKNYALDNGVDNRRHTLSFCTVNLTNPPAAAARVISRDRVHDTCKPSLPTRLASPRPTCCRLKFPTTSG
jgi:hypothetical protein